MATPAAVIGVADLYSRSVTWRGSLSSYYYSGTRDFFVAALCVTALFLMTYMAFQRIRDNRLSTLAGGAAILVALCPTGVPDSQPQAVQTPLQEFLGEGRVQIIHAAAATVFIVSLALICLRFGAAQATIRQRMMKNGREDERIPGGRPAWHYGSASAIFGSIALIVTGSVLDFRWSYLLVGEVVAVEAFGLSWLVKGSELRSVRRRDLSWLLR